MRKGKMRVLNRYKNDRTHRGKTINENEYNRRLQQSMLSCGKQLFFNTNPKQNKGETIII